MLQCHNDRVWLQGLLLHTVLEFAWRREDETPASGDPVQNRCKRNQDDLIKVSKNTNRKFGHRCKYSSTINLLRDPEQITSLWISVVSLPNLLICESKRSQAKRSPAFSAFPSFSDFQDCMWAPWTTFSWDLRSKTICFSPPPFCSVSLYIVLSLCGVFMELDWELSVSYQPPYI